MIECPFRFSNIIYRYNRQLLNRKQYTGFLLQYSGPIQIQDYDQKLGLLILF